MQYTLYLFPWPSYPPITAKVQAPSWTAAALTRNMSLFYVTLKVLDDFNKETWVICLLSYLEVFLGRAGPSLQRPVHRFRTSVVFTLLPLWCPPATTTSPPNSGFQIRPQAWWVLYIQNGMAKLGRGTELKDIFNHLFLGMSTILTARQPSPISTRYASRLLKFPPA